MRERERERAFCRLSCLHAVGGWVEPCLLTRALAVLSFAGGRCEMSSFWFMCADFVSPCPWFTQVEWCISCNRYLALTSVHYIPPAQIRLEPILMRSFEKTGDRATYQSRSPLHCRDYMIDCPLPRLQERTDWIYLPQSD